MWTFMKENKSEWAGRGGGGGGADPHRQAPGHPLNLLCCQGPARAAMPSGSPVDQRPAAGVPRSAVGQSGGRIHAHQALRPFLPTSLDMQQTYDMWLKKHNPGKPGKRTPVRFTGRGLVQMPTDYADIMVTPTHRLVPA